MSENRNIPLLLYQSAATYLEKEGHMNTLQRSFSHSVVTKILCHNISGYIIIIIIIIIIITPWLLLAGELYRPSERRLSAKLVPTFADRGCHMVSVTDHYSCINGFLDRSRYYFFQVAPHCTHKAQ
jgi:hypothetical protein